MSYRIGNGFDVHRLVPNRPLIIGTIKLDYHLGLLGHSDADVLTHAIIDSLLGALCLGDIGSHFPDTDIAYKDISSAKLLAHTYFLLCQHHAKIVNIDSIIVAEQPKMRPYIPNMQTSLCKILNINPTQLSIKATTTENSGISANEQAMAAYSSTLLSLSGK